MGKRANGGGHHVLGASPVLVKGGAATLLLLTGDGDMFAKTAQPTCETPTRRYFTRIGRPATINRT